jgi:hypothetical protein
VRVGFFSAVCCGWLGCASSPAAVDDTATYGRQNGLVWVSGPWEVITPSSDVDAVIDQLCPAIMRLPLAREEDYGREYCGVIYSLSDGLYYASYPSPLSDTRVGRVSSEKNCSMPRQVRDSRGESKTIADYHNHPWTPSSMLRSINDRLSAMQLYSIRIQFDTACNIQKFIPYVNEERPGELYERHGKRWKLIGLVKPEDKSRGRITPIDD